MLTPNFADPRNLRRAQQAIVWIEQYFRRQPIRRIARVVLDDNFGQQQNKTSAWLRAQLLTVIDEHYNMHQGMCKSYSVNRVNLSDLKTQLGVDSHQLAMASAGAFLDQPMVYTDIKDRSYHPLQTYSRSIRNPLLARRGYVHDYDICCASATVISQLARSRGLLKPQPALDEYCADRTQVRRRLGEELGIEVSKIKEILTALCMGGRLSTYRDSKLFAVVDFRVDQMRGLQQHPWINQFKQDLKLSWLAIRSREVTPQKLTSRYRAEIYRREEASIGKIIRRHLSKRKIQYFWIHDGWMSQQGVNVLELTDQIRQQTGYELKFDYQQYHGDGDIC